MPSFGGQPRRRWPILRDRTTLDHFWTRVGGLGARGEGSQRLVREPAGFFSSLGIFLAFGLCGGFRPRKIPCCIRCEPALRSVLLVTLEERNGNGGSRHFHCADIQTFKFLQGCSCLHILVRSQKWNMSDSQ